MALNRPSQNLPDSKVKLKLQEAAQTIKDLRKEISSRDKEISSKDKEIKRLKSRRRDDYENFNQHQNNLVETTKAALAEKDREIESLKKEVLIRSSESSTCLTELNAKIEQLQKERDSAQRLTEDANDERDKAVKDKKTALSIVSGLTFLTIVASGFVLMSQKEAFAEIVVWFAGAWEGIKSAAVWLWETFIVMAQWVSRSWGVKIILGYVFTSVFTLLLALLLLWLFRRLFFAIRCFVRIVIHRSDSSVWWSASFSLVVSWLLVCVVFRSQIRSLLSVSFFPVWFLGSILFLWIWSLYHAREAPEDFLQRSSSSW